MALDVVCARQAPALVRAALSAISELDAVRGEATLIATELVTNAVVHSGGRAADTIHVQALLRAGNVLISVDDPGRSADIPRMQDPNVQRVSGHGLQIVNQLARQWGVGPNGGHRVWAELARGDEDD
jgi:anti-sigma regulatory factor (Ser/Thr protein kinase)